MCARGPKSVWEGGEQVLCVCGGGRVSDYVCVRGVNDYSMCVWGRGNVCC